MLKSVFLRDFVKMKEPPKSNLDVKNKLFLQQNTYLFYSFGILPSVSCSLLATKREPFLEKKKKENQISK